MANISTLPVQQVSFTVDLRNGHVSVRLVMENRDRLSISTHDQAVERALQDMANASVRQFMNGLNS